jgi:hypothetical protein
MMIFANRTTPRRTCSGVQTAVHYVGQWMPQQVRHGGLWMAILFLIFVPSAFADNAPKQAAVLTAPVITDKDCAQLADYQPSADVNYKPGVDVNGNPVVPADLTPNVIDAPKKISFDMSANYAGQAGMTLPAGSQGLATIGKVTVDTTTGEVTWNGKPVEGDAMAALKNACANRKPPDSSQNK